MNLVLHPSSADRYVPPHINKPRRRGASISAPQQRSGYQTPASRSTPTPSHYRSADNPNNITTPMLPSQSPGFSSSQGYFGPQSASSDTLSYGPPTPFSAVPSDSGHPTWGYPPQTADRNTSFPPPALPSIHSFGRNSATTGFLSRRGPRAPDEPDVASDRIFAKYPYLAQNEFELRATIKRPIFGSAVLLFTCITAHWVFNITRAYQAFVLYKGGGQPLKIFSDMSQTSEVVKTGLVAASNLICDAMLIYRLWIIWERKLKVILFPVGTLLGLLVSAIGIIYQYTQFTPEEGIYDTEADRWVTSNCAFTIGTNLYCTALIAWRVWQTHGAFKALGSRNNLNQKPQL
ncbi:hypothetical protein K435DRAFT_367877 [Dendrothele bispora CBS 962.96]|uniref:Uncharacterized protein n=1 Tax=Dendrothele bispora (strain CBS 962.96) TaxID=1314807 RepID=A0A4S8MH78_DENBC|nr:hypothetical protein K435DRAFT_367877 [Dendrothele bispora CBS 962.96]